MKAKYIFFLIFLSTDIFCQPTYNLAQVLKLAKANNPYLRTSQLDIELAQTDVISARLRPNPVLNNQSLQLLKSSAFKHETSWLSGANTQTWWQFTKAFQIKGQRQNKIELAKRNVGLSEKKVLEFERNVFTDVANKWVEAWVIQKKITLLREAIQNIDTLVNINTYRFKKQVIPETELLRTQLISRQYAIQLNSIRQEYAQQINELKFLIGVNETFNIDEMENVNLEQYYPSDSLIQIAFRNRPDLLSLVAAENASEANIKLQESLAFPQPELGFIYNPQNTMPYFGIYATIELPFFSRNQGEIQKAKVQRMQVKTQIEATKRSISTQLLNAVSQVSVNKKNAEEFLKIIAQSDLILANVRYAYTRGGTTIIDFLEAQRGWLDAQQQYAEILQKHKQSQIQLLYVTGLIQNLIKQ